MWHKTEQNNAILIATRLQITTLHASLKDEHKQTCNILRKSTKQHMSRETFRNYETETNKQRSWSPAKFDIYRKTISQHKSGISSLFPFLFPYTQDYLEAHSVFDQQSV